MLKLSLADEPVRFLTNWYGDGIALGFKSHDKPAVERCLTWAVNSGVAKGLVHWTYDKASIGYVNTTMERIKRGLRTQFYVEAIMRREFPPLKDEMDDDGNVVIEYDEKKLEAVAKSRMEAFVAERLESESFLTSIARSVAPIYDTGSMRRVGAPIED